MKNYIKILTVITLIVSVITGCSGKETIDDTIKNEITTTTATTATTTSSGEYSEQNEPNVPNNTLDTSIFDNITFDKPVTQLNVNQNTFLHSEIGGYINNKIYLIKTGENFDTNQKFYFYNTNNGETQLIQTVPDFSIYGTNSCAVGNYIFTMTQSGTDYICIATDITDNSSYEMYRGTEVYEENENELYAESFRYLHSVNATQFIEYWVDFNLYNYNKNVHIKLGNVTTVNNEPEIQFTEINTENIQSLLGNRNLLYGTVANDNKIYFLTSKDITVSDLTLYTFDLNGNLLLTDNLDIVDNFTAELENKEVRKFNIVGNILTINFHNSKQLVVKLTDGLTSEIIFDNLEYQKPIHSTNSNNFVLFEKTYAEDYSVEGYGYLDHYKVYLYNSQSGQLTGLVEGDFTWVIANDEKLVYGTSTGECYSVSLFNN
ncbi:hypothetical protein FACS1894132_09060 [Clostridia bacterium]|nr:hypothetical protein FACS1894132_09060 [Clostridia bacterium]